jgi:hypothetical protein
MRTPSGWPIIVIWSARQAITRCLKPSQPIFPAQNTLAEVWADRLLTYVQLHKALGGGWNLTDAQWSGPQAKSQGQ